MTHSSLIPFTAMPTQRRLRVSPLIPQGHTALLGLRTTDPSFGISNFTFSKNTFAPTFKLFTMRMDVLLPPRFRISFPSNRRFGFASIGGTLCLSNCIYAFHVFLLNPTSFWYSAP
ncbi:uncharacterized protein BT62DRAFT_429951 [Guyanagaster necrorhizus]|uniref:Uncharacterized protein n=1 Tax=Guyanagaster necrorhizus TaxID=856835 RepID=A0A9P8AZ25_9AGAR|nr:uncharacterized protein BT62DRAFT_429951 [Guyanagaster necrorhizus MCA 3950]KAG7451522.1 hypothetical protein BT62DRAFT_429951 [Guyanagaster necrorhizus MCA 3950]